MCNSARVEKFAEDTLRRVLDPVLLADLPELPSPPPLPPIVEQKTVAEAAKDSVARADQKEKAVSTEVEEAEMERELVGKENMSEDNDASEKSASEAEVGLAEGQIEMETDDGKVAKPDVELQRKKLLLRQMQMRERVLQERAAQARKRKRLEQVNRCELLTNTRDHACVFRHLVLFFALCTKKQELFTGLMTVYGQASPFVRQCVHGQLPALIRTLGASPKLLECIRESHKIVGCESIVLHVLSLLTKNAVPTKALVEAVKTLYFKRKQDPRFLIPILPGLTKDATRTLLSRYQLLICV